MTRRTRNRLGRLRSLDRSRARRIEHQAEEKRQKQVGPAFVMTFGKHAGMRLLEVPAGYLRWILSVDGHTLAKKAARELDRRERIRERAGGTL